MRWAYGPNYNLKVDHNHLLLDKISYFNIFTGILDILVFLFTIIYDSQKLFNKTWNPSKLS